MKTVGILNFFKATNQIPQIKSHKENFLGFYLYYRVDGNLALYKLLGIRAHNIYLCVPIVAKFHSNYRERSRFVAPVLRYNLRECYAGELLILLVNITVSVACK